MWLDPVVCGLLLLGRTLQLAIAAERPRRRQPSYGAALRARRQAQRRSGWRCRFRRPGVGHGRQQSNAASYAGAANPMLNQRMRPRERPAATVLGTAWPAVAAGLGQSECSSALRRSIKDLIGDASRRMFLLHHTAQSSLARVIHKHHREHLFVAIGQFPPSRNPVPAHFP
jgi:hypothetical protein